MPRLWHVGYFHSGFVVLLHNVFYCDLCVNYSYWIPYNIFSHLLLTHCMLVCFQLLNSCDVKCPTPCFMAPLACLLPPLEHRVWFARPGVGAASVRRRWFVQERWESGQVRDGTHGDIFITVCPRVATINNWLLAHTSTLH